ncbi:MAG: D-tyrosyl-tRNA(Tyr) deacylase, partial [Bdellovibrionales bacterium]|nr:D-tyrosyl-tRNA(Tyr) deacylase [Bdellovibrionales bacterium]
MKVLLQRVNHASVTVENSSVGAIQQGLLLLVGFGVGDTESKIPPLVEKISNLRVFSDERGRFNYSVRDIEGAILLVPQFTLFADTKKGRRPEFFAALDPIEAKRLFEILIQEFKKVETLEVASGIFVAYMQVKLENDG